MKTPKGFFPCPDLIPAEWGCYAVYLNEECMYVGTSSDLRHRIRVHRANPWFKAYSKEKQIDWFISTGISEYEAIRTLKPRLNPLERRDTPK